MVDENALDLSEFLGNLRTELDKAQERAQSGRLKLGVDKIEVELDMAYTREDAAEVGGTASVKFWVFGSAEASAAGSRSSERARTQRLRLTLTPRVEVVEVDEQGETIVQARGLQVRSPVGPHEEAPG